MNKRNFIIVFSWCATFCFCVVIEALIVDQTGIGIGGVWHTEIPPEEDEVYKSCPHKIALYGAQCSALERIKAQISYIEKAEKRRREAQLALDRQRETNQLIRTKGICGIKIGQYVYPKRDEWTGTTYRTNVHLDDNEWGPKYEFTSAYVDLDHNSLVKNIKVVAVILNDQERKAEARRWRDKLNRDFKIELKPIGSDNREQWQYIGDKYYILIDMGAFSEFDITIKSVY